LGSSPRPEFSKIEDSFFLKKKSVPSFQKQQVSVLLYLLCTITVEWSDFSEFVPAAVLHPSDQKEKEKKEKKKKRKKNLCLVL
jgi:hypothetical protein